MLKRLTFAALLAVVFHTSEAQQKSTTGDVVAYFGKERIERVDEGVVVHNFNQGYFVPNTTQNGYLFQMGDVLAWEIFTDNFQNPYSGDLSATNYGRTRERVQWMPIASDSSGKFQDRQLRRSYLYSQWDAPKSEVLLLQATGGTRTIINGLPHEGDHYDFGYTLIPFVSKKGDNSFLFTQGRFGYVEAKVIKPEKPVMFTKRDMTVADVLIGEGDQKWAAVRVVNSSSKAAQGLSIKCELSTGETATYKTEDVMDMSVRKLPFLLPASSGKSPQGLSAQLTLLDKSNKVVDTMTISLRLADPRKIHERTFRSRVDSSVQYFSVNPSSTVGEGQALVLSVHGASVEARNQARAYGQKDWAYIVAPTNRRPFGYNWEEWGRIDAMEVLAEAKRLFKTAPEKTYLTGHSMGGHGTWILGATYPDKFAAIAPCAGYADIAGYGSRGNNPDARNRTYDLFDIVERGSNGGRTLKLKRNYLQSGVFVHHGDADRVVPVDQARAMREELATFHPDFAYHEEPGGSHWYSNESVDFAPIFNYFKWHTIPSGKEVKKLEFYTASPAISATDYWLTIVQQEKSYEVSNVKLEVKGDSIVGTTHNVAALVIDFNQTPISGDVVVSLDGKNLNIKGEGHVALSKSGDVWTENSGTNPQHKSPVRGGGFKTAFDNDVVFVYSTAGSKAENEWYKNKARFDAENFLYRGNGSVDVVSDVEFLSGDFSWRNVIIYGNSETNKAWSAVLSESAPLVKQGSVTVGERVIEGDDLGVVYVYPRSGTTAYSVGVVAGTSLLGAKATYTNDYLTGFTSYPDLMVFSVDMLRRGMEDVECVGFFENDWSVGDDFKFKN